MDEEGIFYSQKPSYPFMNSGQGIPEPRNMASGGDLKMYVFRVAAVKN